MLSHTHLQAQFVFPQGHSGGVNCVAYRADGKRIISGSDEIKEWDPNTGQCLRTFEGHSRAINSVAYRADGKRIISGSSDGSIKEWEVDSGDYSRNLSNVFGLQVQGWDFRGAQHDFTEEEQRLLRMYSAILDDEDAARWERLMAEEEEFYAE